MGCKAPVGNMGDIWEGPGFRSQVDISLLGAPTILAGWKAYGEDHGATGLYPGSLSFFLSLSHEISKFTNTSALWQQETAVTVRRDHCLPYS